MTGLEFTLARFFFVFYTRFLLPRSLTRQPLSTSELANVSSPFLSRRRFEASAPPRTYFVAPDKPLTGSPTLPRVGPEPRGLRADYATWPCGVRSQRKEPRKFHVTAGRGERRKGLRKTAIAQKRKLRGFLTPRLLGLEPLTPVWSKLKQRV